jgi:hypothetical protein
MAGQGRFNGALSPTFGTGSIDLALFHPADVRGAIFDLTWVELREYCDAWRKGRHWMISPSSIPIDYLTAAGKVWAGGGIYSNNAAMTPPANWIGTKAETNSWASTELLLRDTSRQQLTFSVQVTLQPGPNVFCSAVQVHVPADWQVGAIDNGGELDAQGRLLKWGPFFGNLRRKLTFEVAPNSAHPEPPSFPGVASFDGVSQAMTNRSVRASELAVRLHGDQVQLTLWGETGKAYRLETSPNLTDWSPLSSSTSSTGVLFWDQPWTKRGTTFYRAVAE